MSAGNAFAQVADAGELAGVAKSKQDSRPKKRVRLSDPEATAVIQTRCAQEDTAVEVDIMILDYVLFQATDACLSRQQSSTDADPFNLKRSLEIADSFLEIFKDRHPSYKPDAELDFRFRLLSFTTLFVTRMTRGPATQSLSSLRRIRAANKARAHAWIGEKSRIPTLPFNTRSFELQCPLSSSALQHNRVFILSEHGVDGGDCKEFYGSEECVSLLDILPMFMHLSAARASLSNCSMNMVWMRLACEFMLQACLEQYMVYGADGSDVIDEAFAWGHIAEMPDTENAVADEDAAPALINNMFEDEEDEDAEVEGWAQERSRWLRKLFSGDDVPESTNVDDGHPSRRKLASHLGALLREHEVSRFRDTVVNFLLGLHHSIPEPVLHQLEKRKLDGMSEEQTQSFLNASGIAGDLLSIFESPVR